MNMEINGTKKHVSDSFMDGNVKMNTIKNAQWAIFTHNFTWEITSALYDFTRQTLSGKV